MDTKATIGLGLLLVLTVLVCLVYEMLFTQEYK